LSRTSADGTAPSAHRTSRARWPLSKRT
jgi:hypothetical protein